MSLCDYLRHPPPRLLQQSLNARKRTELFWPVIACDFSGQGQKALAFSAGQDYSPSAGMVLILRWRLWAMAVWYVEKQNLVRVRIRTCAHEFRLASIGPRSNAYSLPTQPAGQLF